MEVWTGFGVMQCHAIFLDRRVRESTSAARNRFDCPDDAQVAGMRLRLASNFLTIPAPSPCVFFENWTRSQAMWQSQHLPLRRGSF
ncbi:MAG: hypothetical protein DMF01_06750 [Verrucomicrobia bacterium]|nr:MAG: hypothetical protein DMF01_06750 [Verrucomicrobiota bacterium]